MKLNREQVGALYVRRAEDGSPQILLVTASFWSPRAKPKSHDVSGTSLLESAFRSARKLTGDYNAC